MLDRLGQAVVAALLLLVALSGPGAPSAAAQTASADPFSVTGVSVDVTAASAADARDKAISEAQHKAFEMLFRRIVADSAHRVVPAVLESDLQRMIQGFEIEQERGSEVRYVASMAFKFRPKAVTTYLSSMGLQLVDMGSPPAAAAPATAAAPAAVAAPAVPAKPVLVLPLAQGAAAVLWEERTPWRSAWEDYAAGAGAGKLLVPAGELTDIADIGAKEAVAGDAASVTKIAAHYDAGQVVVVALTGTDRLDTGAGAQVVVNRYGSDGQPAAPAETVAVVGTAGEAVPVFLGRAVALVAGKLLATPAAPAVASDVPVQAVVPIAGMLDWLEVRRRLTSDPMVTAVDTVALTRGRVDVAIHYRGEVDGLRAMLERDGLTLVQGPGGWEIYIRAAVAQPMAAPVVAPMPAPAPVSGPASVPAAALYPVPEASAPAPAPSASASAGKP